MTTSPKELSPERCHQLRQGDDLRTMVNRLHEHTLEPQDKPEADVNIEAFLMDFKRKSKQRDQLSQQLRTIVKHTAKNEDELQILGMLELLREYIGRLYNFMGGWKAITEDPSKLNECTDQLTELAGLVKAVIKELKTLTADDAIRPIFKQFGGAFVIVDYLQAQTRFNTKCHQFKSNLIDTSPLLGVADDSKLVLRDAVIILWRLVLAPHSSDDIQTFLGKSRSLQEIMIGLVEDAYDDGDLLFVQVYCSLLGCLYYTNEFTLTGIMPYTSHLKDCGVIKYLVKFGMEIKDPQTLYHVLAALQASLRLNHGQNLFEFLSIDGAVNMLIDVLMPSKEKDEDVKNAKWYEKQRYYSADVLNHIQAHFVTVDHMDPRLLAIYESGDFAALLLRHLELTKPMHESSEVTRCVLSLLWNILFFSDDQRRKFMEIANRTEVLQRFESSDYEDSAQLSRIIGVLFG